MSARRIWQTAIAIVTVRERVLLGILTAVLSGLVLLAVRKTPTQVTTIVAMLYAPPLHLVFAWLIGRRGLTTHQWLLRARVPHAGSTVLGVVLLHAVVWTLGPALLVGAWCSIGVIGMATIFVAAATLAIMGQVAPAIVGVGSVFGLICGLQFFIETATVDPRAIWLTWLITVSGALVAVWRWRAMVRDEAQPTSPWLRPSALQRFDLAQTDKRTPITEASAFEVGRSTPVPALRVWLGGDFVPQRIDRQLLHVAAALIIVVAPALGRHWNVLEEHGALPFVMGLGAGIPLGGFARLLIRLQRVYTNLTGELPLLVLLPGFPAAKAKRVVTSVVLRTLWGSLAPWAAGFSGGVLLTSSCSQSLLSPTQVGVVALIWLLGGLIAMAWSVSVIGGRTISTAISVILGVLVFALLGSTVIAFGIERGFVFPLATLLAIVAVCVWLLVRGWNALQRRPHPFLLNA